MMITNNIKDMTLYKDWIIENPDGEYIDWLICSVGDNWNIAVNHNMYDKMADGSLSDNQMGFYLAQDYLFFEDFLRITGSMISVAPNIVVIKDLGEYLSHLVGTENDYFIRSFKELGVDIKNVELCSVMKKFQATIEQAMQTNSFTAMLSCYVIFEKLYLDWATRCKDYKTDKFYFTEWIDLHNMPMFADNVNYFIKLLNIYGANQCEKGHLQNQQFFADCLKWEIEFPNTVMTL